MLMNAPVEVEDLRHALGSLGRIGRIYASLPVGIAGTVRKPSDEVILLL
jgi:hypothetical protein